MRLKRVRPRIDAGAVVVVVALLIAITPPRDPRRLAGGLVAASVALAERGRRELAVARSSRLTSPERPCSSGAIGRLPPDRRVVPGGPTRPVWAPARWRRRSTAVHAQALARDLDAIASAVRAGLSLRDALSVATGGALDAIVVDLDAGFDLGEACRRSAGRATGDPEQGLAVASLAIAAVCGGDRARAIDAAADAVRERAALAAEARAHAAQATLSAAVLVALPPLFALWSLASDRATRDVLVGQPVGWVCLGAGIVLDAVGALWMRALVRGAVR